MSRQRDRDRSKRALPALKRLPGVSYDEVARATFGSAESEMLSRWFGDHDHLSRAGSAADGVAMTADGSLLAFDYRLTEVGLDPKALSSQRADWERLGQLLFRFDRSMQWLIGDWLLQGEDKRWGQHEAIAAKLGLQVKTLYDYRYVARQVDFSVRTEKLSFGHHKLVAQLQPSRQRHWLQRAAAGDSAGDSRPWSISRMRQEMRQEVKASPAEAALEETPFERNLRRIDREMTRRKWNRLPAAERCKRHAALQKILERMELWGLD